MGPCVCTNFPKPQGEEEGNVHHSFRLFFRSCIQLKSLMDEDLPCQPFQLENPSEMLPVVKIKNEAMDAKPFQLEDPSDAVQVVLRVKEELSDVKDLLYEPLELETSTEFLPVLSIKEELLDIKDEFISGHDQEISSAHIMDGCNSDSDNIKLEDGSDEDPLSIVEKQSGCGSPVKASCNYEPSERTRLYITNREIDCDHKTPKKKDLNNSALDNEVKPANCVTECGKKGMHTVHHVEERKFICDECEKCFTERRRFVAHFLIHSRERKHKCQYCAKCFTQRSHLASHSLIHSGERKHKCQHCGKSFLRCNDLVKHLLTHSGERKHKCQDCGKCFSERSNLVRHYLIHSGEKKHKCQDCAKCFTRRSHLVRHSQLHNGERKHI